VCEIKGLQVEFYFSRDVASGEKMKFEKGGGIKYRFRTIIYTPAILTKVISVYFYFLFFYFYFLEIQQFLELLPELRAVIGEENAR
jgi:hypothetical protein